MPNREELACVHCPYPDNIKSNVCERKPSADKNERCVIELAAADRVIAAGWKSPIECNKCIDEGALRTSNAIDKAVETIFDHLFSFELTDDGKGVYLGFSIQQLKDIGQYPVTILRKGEYRE